MKKYFVILLFVFALNAHADTNIPNGNISDSNWSPAGGTYIISGNVAVPLGATLTIEPGTIIKFKQGGAAVLNVDGTLIANGTIGGEIYFTSINDDSVGGDTNLDATSSVPVANDWQGIYFNQGSTGNIDYSTIRYGGYGGSGYGDFVGIENNGGEVSIDHSLIDQDNQKGVWQRGGITNISNTVLSNNLFGMMTSAGTTTVSNSSIENNSQYGFYSENIDSLILTNNNFSGNARTAIINAGVDFSHTGNTSSDITNRGFDITGTPKDGSHWNSLDLPILISTGSIYIPVGCTLSIDPGTVIKLGNAYSSGSITVDGNLFASGSKLYKIYFTSIKDDSKMGDTNGDGSISSPAVLNWQALVFNSGSNIDFKNVVVRYGGTSIGLPGLGETIYNSGNFSAENSFFGYNFSSGIYMDSGTTTLIHNELTAQPLGIRYRGGNLSASENSFYGNQFGILEESSLNQIDARNNWWGSDLGPTNASLSTPAGAGDKINGNIVYTPWLTRDPLLSSPHNPLIIVPGIMSSQLLDSNLGADNLIWPSLTKIGLSPSDDFLDSLKMNKDGESANPGIYVGDVMRKINSTDYYQGLITSLTSSGYIEGIDLFVYPYDWRADLDVTVSKLNEKINQVKIQTGSLKVDLLAHSMGGLLVKKFLIAYNSGSVDNFVDISTPHIGSPSSFKILSYGDDLGVRFFLGFFGLNSNRIKSISQNMPAVYELLPSRSYFDNTDMNYNYYVFDGVNKSDRLTFDQTKNYLKTNGRNNTLVDKADAFHREIDGLNPATYGVKTYNIVGCGTPTLGQIYVLDQAPDGHFSYNIRMINGDGTVPLKSAEAIPALKTYFVKNAKHAVLPGTVGVKELVTSILNGDINPDISSYSNIVTTDTACPVTDGQMVSFHSPIDLNIYDSNGNHTGPDVNGDIENNIQGVDYEVIEDNKFAYLPVGHEYSIVGKSTGVGTFDVRIENIVNGEVATTTIFNDVPISLNSQTKFAIGAAPTTQILLDKDGNGVFGITKDASAVSSGLLESTGKVKPLSVNKTTDVPVAPTITGARRVNTQSSQISVNQVASVFKAKIESKASILKQNRIVPTAASVLKPEKVYRNGALVDKSLTQTIKNTFRTLWSWIKSKL
jgi:pimeloyl-ACP methyl ester carboxylesterase